MAARMLLAITLAWGLSTVGCAPAPRVNTVPWWKGIPLMVIEPTSLEAMVWRDYLHNRQRSAVTSPSATAGGAMPVHEPLPGEAYFLPDEEGSVIIPDPELKAAE